MRNAKLQSKIEGGELAMGGIARGRTSVALVQRSIPHYRLALFQRLAADPSYDWTFYCGEHDESRHTGLQALLTGLRTRPIVNRRVCGNLICQSGIPVRRHLHQAVMVDYGWTIVSNPLLFARARMAGVATIGWSKGISQQTSSTKTGLRRRMERASISLCDSLVVYGEMSRDYFVDLGFEPSRIFVAQNTIDTREIASRREAADLMAVQRKRELGMDLMRPVVGFLGKINPEKKVDCIIRAFELARSSGCDGQLLIAGRGPASAEIDQMIRTSPYGSDIFRLPDVPPGGEPEVFRMMDVYASFSQAGLGILEALASAVAVVATPDRFPETELLEAGHTALLSKDSSVKAFGDMLALALRDRELRHKVARSGNDVVLSRATLEGMIAAITTAVQAALVLRGYNRPLHALEVASTRKEHSRCES